MGTVRAIRWTKEENERPDLDWSALRWLTNSVKLEDHQEGDTVLDIAVRQLYALPVEDQTVIASAAKAITLSGMKNVGVNVALEIVCAVAMQQERPVENLAAVQISDNWASRSITVSDRLNREEQKPAEEQDAAAIRGMRLALGLTPPQPPSDSVDALSYMLEITRLSPKPFTGYDNLQNRIEQAKGAAYPRLYHKGQAHG